MLGGTASGDGGEPPGRSGEVEDHPRFRGVRKRKWGKYVSEIRLPHSRERIWLGSYDTAEKAARAFDAAQFCLRGPNSKFNIPDDPPDIPGGQSLTPLEIQAVAQQYGNEFRGSSSTQLRPPPNGGDVDHHAQIHSSRSMNSIDWSFLDTNNSHNEAAWASDHHFGVFPEPGEVYMPPCYAAKSADRSEEEDYNGWNNSLWNFE